MENEAKNGNPPDGSNPVQPPQWGQSQQNNYPPQGPQPPQQGSYSNQPPQYHQPQGQCPPPQGQYSNQPPYYNQPPQHYVTKNLYGVRGWLMFLCIYFTIIMPVLSVIIFGISLDDVKLVSAHYPEFGTLAVIDALMSTLVLGFFIFAGCCLWAVRPHAVGIAKACLIFGMIYRLTVFVLLLTASGLPMRIKRAMVPSITVQLLIAVGILLAWFVYLCVSKRVAITYAKKQ